MIGEVVFHRTQEGSKKEGKIVRKSEKQRAGSVVEMVRPLLWESKN